MPAPDQTEPLDPALSESAAAAAPSLRERLASLSSAEEFLAFFGVEADPARLAPNRMALLRLLNRTLADQEALGATPDQAFAHCRQVLAEAYGRVAAGETLRRPRGNFVSLQSLHRSVHAPRRR